MLNEELLAGETMKNPPRTVTVKQVKLSGHICSDDDKILLVRSIKTFTENWDSKRHLLELSWPT